MSYIDRPLSAIERARAAYEELMQRQRALALARQARERTRRTIFLVSLGAVSAVLLGIVIYNGWLPQGLRSSILAGDTVSNGFGSSRTGQVRSLVQGNTCQELKFSNDSGSFVSGNLVSCEAVVTKQVQPPSKGSRVNSIRDAFTR
jgi:hypothetical protein